MEEVFLSQGATFETHLSTVGSCDAIDDTDERTLACTIRP